MAVGFVQTFGITQWSNSTNKSLTGVNPTAGNNLYAPVAVWRVGGGAEVTSITSSHGTWSRVARTSADINNGRLELWKCPNASAGSATVTLNNNGGTFPLGQFCVFEVSGLDSTPLDVTAEFGATSSSTSTPSGTTGNTAQNDEIAIALHGNVSTDAEINWAKDAAYQLINQDGRASSYTALLAQYKILTATGTQSATATHDNDPNRHGLIVTLKGAAAGRTVSCSTEQLTATEAAATVNRERGVAGGSESLLLTPATAGVSRGRLVASLTEALELAEASATINRSRGVSGSVEQLQFVPAAAAVNRARLVAGATEQLQLTPAAAAVNRSRIAGALTEALILATNQATVNRGRLVAAITEALVVTENAATIERGSTGRVVSCITEALVLAAGPASVNRSRLVISPTEQLQLTPSGATVSFGRAVSAATEILILTPASAAINRSRIVSALTEILQLTPGASAVNRARTIAAAIESLLITPAPATVSRSRLVAALTEALELSVNPATIVKGGLGFVVDRRFVRSALAASLQRRSTSADDTLELTADSQTKRAR